VTIRRVSNDREITVDFSSDELRESDEETRPPMSHPERDDSNAEMGSRRPVRNDPDAENAMPML